MGDQLKNDAAETVRALRAIGITPWLVTGDSAQVAASVANTVGIDAAHVISAALPEDKLRAVERLKSDGGCVLMIGDGINDAAALTAADLSMAMGTGTDTAISSADITLMNSGLGSVIDALKLAKRHCASFISIWVGPLSTTLLACRSPPLAYYVLSMPQRQWRSHRYLS